MAYMPGESTGVQFAPQQAAGTPAAVVNNVKQITDLPTLIRMMGTDPSVPLLRHIDDVRKQKQARKSVQNMLAMQQAQQQGPTTLKDQVLGQAAQVAGMAPARTMATGGIVALKDGGLGAADIDAADLDNVVAEAPRVEEPKYENPDFDEEGRPRGTTEKNAIIQRNRLRQQAFERTRQGAPRSLTDVKPMIPLLPIEAIHRLQEFPPVGRGMAAEASATPAAAASRALPEDFQRRTDIPAEGIVRQAPSAQRGATREKPPTERQQGTAPAAAPAAAPPDQLAQAFAALNQAYQPPTISPEVKAQREKVSGIQALQEQQALEDAQRIRDETVRVGQRRMDRANLPLLENPQALATLAGSIDARKGKLFPSLFTGIGSALTAQEAQKEKAEEYVSTQSERVRALNNTYRQLQLENAKYQEAKLTGDSDKIRESQQKLAELAYKYQHDSQKLAIDRMEAQAKVAMAGKPSGEIALMEWLRSPSNRILFDEIQSGKRAEERLIKLRELYDKRPLSAADMTFSQFVNEFNSVAGKKEGPPSGTKANPIKLD